MKNSVQVSLMGTFVHEEGLFLVALVESRWEENSSDPLGSGHPLPPYSAYAQYLPCFFRACQQRDLAIEDDLYLPCHSAIEVSSCAAAADVQEKKDPLQDNRARVVLKRCTCKAQPF